jgi:CheY-like chemotaxis protein
MIKKRILVIDDDNDVRAMIYANLTDCGYEVIEASNGEMCMNILETQTLPDLVITDIVMPRKDGLEVVMEIRQKYPDLKLISISGGGRSWGGDYLAMSQKLGADAILPKPLNMNDLEDTIKKLVS